MKVEVVGLPTADCEAVRLTDVGRLSGLKAGGWQQSCDFLLACAEDGRDIVVLVELKKSLLPGAKKGKEQLRRSLPRARALELVCQIHYGTVSDGREAEVKYCLIAKRMSARLDKQRIRAVARPMIETYEGIAIKCFVRDRVLYNELVG